LAPVELPRRAAAPAAGPLTVVQMVGADPNAHGEKPIKSDGVLAHPTSPAGDALRPSTRRAAVAAVQGVTARRSRRGLFPLGIQCPALPVGRASPPPGTGTGASALLVVLTQPANCSSVRSRRGFEGGGRGGFLGGVRCGSTTSICRSGPRDEPPSRQAERLVAAWERVEGRRAESRQNEDHEPQTEPSSTQPRATQPQFVAVQPTARAPAARRRPGRSARIAHERHPRPLRRQQQVDQVNGSDRREGKGFIVFVRSSKRYGLLLCGPMTAQRRAWQNCKSHTGHALRRVQRVVLNPCQANGAWARHGRPSGRASHPDSARLVQPVAPGP